jgi:hypothetical protein
MMCVYVLVLGMVYPVYVITVKRLIGCVGINGCMRYSFSG